MYREFGAVLIFLIVGAAFVAAGMLAGALIRLRRDKGAKRSIYECGEPTIGSSWIRFNSRFYNVALVYLLFDVEVVLLIPVLLVFREQVLKGFGPTMLLAVLVFLGLLVLGLAYEWCNGNLDWIRQDQNSFDSEKEN